MKALFLLAALIVSSYAIAGTLPKEKSPCNWGSHCVDFDGLDIGLKHILNGMNKVGLTDKFIPGTYYQRATGPTCLEAIRNAKEKLLFNRSQFMCDYDGDGKKEVRCNIKGEGPRLYQNSCMKSGKGETVAWILCDSSGDSSRKYGPRKTGSAVGFIMLENLKSSEARGK